MIAGNFKTYELTIAAAGHAELDLSAVVTTEKLVRTNTDSAKIRLLVTPAGSSTNASATDYLLDDEDTEFELGPGLDRLSFYNGDSGEKKVSVAVLF